MKKQKTKAASLMKGCLITILTVSAVLSWTFWQIVEPDRRAKRIHAAIRSGMSCGDVEELLTGRYFCFFQVQTNSGWLPVSKPAFEAIIAAAPTNNPPPLRLQLHFMGMSPRRVSFTAELDHQGNVTNVTRPYGWE